MPECGLGVDMENQNLIHEDGERGIFRVHRSAFTSTEIAAIERQVKSDIAAAVEFAVNSPYPKPETAERDFFA